MDLLKKTIPCLLLLGWLVPAHAQTDSIEIRTKPLQAIEKRSPSADGRFVDLGPYYNFSLSEEIHCKPGNTISIPTGISDYKGVMVDSRGVIQLSSKVAFQNSHIEYPREIHGIIVNHRADSLCFLQSSAWASPMGTEVASIVVHYEDGQERIITIRYQVDVEDWWFNPDNSVIPPHARVAWEGSNERVEELGMSLKLYLYTWVNPLPELEIISIDLISSMNDTGYMLFGLTCL